MNTKQRFSIRKYKIGAVSVLLGTLLFMVEYLAFLQMPSQVITQIQVLFR